MASTVNYSNQAERVRRGQEPGNTSAFFNVLFHGVVGVFLFAYAFRNPDYEVCWASNIPEVTFAFEQSDTFLETVNVSQTFRLWFTIGFGISAFSLMYTVLAGIYIVKK